MTAATSSSRLGSPKKATAAGAIARRESATTSCGTSSVERALDDEGGGAACHGICREVVPVRTRAADAEEERARTDGAGVVSEIRDVHGRGVHDRRAGASAWASTLELHA